MKITIIGGGSTYTPELVSGFLERISSLPLRELWLLDIDPQRLEVVGGFAQRMAAAKGQPFSVHLSSDRAAAIAGASYVITQLRVGGMAARRGDEYLGKRHNLIGQETTGIGGMAKALRTIPVILDIAAEIERSAPGALLLNFTNPAGLVTEALKRYVPAVQSVGVCNSAINLKMELLHQAEKLLGRTIPTDQAVLDTLGLNHLTWYRGFTVFPPSPREGGTGGEGQDLWPQLFAAFLNEQKQSQHPEWDVPLVDSLGVMFNYYLQYFYHTDKKLREQQNWPPSRAEQVMEVEHELLDLYADPTLTEPPAELMKRGGAYYSTLATQLIDSHFNDRGEIHVVNTRHAGAAAGFPADWVLELPCRVDKAGIHPLPAKPLPLACIGLITQVKMYELLTVEAAVQGSRKAAYEALLAHPIGPQADRIQIVLDDMLATNAAWLPQFHLGNSVLGDSS